MYTTFPLYGQGRVFTKDRDIMLVVVFTGKDALYVLAEYGTEARLLCLCTGYHEKDASAAPARFRGRPCQLMIPFSCPYGIGDVTVGSSNF